MPAQIFRNLSEADDLFRAALIGLGVVLFVLTSWSTCRPAGWWSSSTAG